MQMLSRLSRPSDPGTERGEAIPRSRKPLCLSTSIWLLFGKPLVEVFLAGVALLLLGPLVLLAAVVVKLTSRGPAFYTQLRAGKHGRAFTIYKIRTMYHNAEAVGGAVWAASQDPRVTPVGHLLRILHIDEFPQVLNVLRGEMSLVGPRPERPQFVEILKLKIDGYTDRLSVRPGITGLAQVQLPPDTDLDDVRRKLVCDRYYIQHVNAWLDFRLLLCTGLFLFGMPLSLTGRLLRIPRPLGQVKN